MRWSVIGASVTGTSHLKLGRGCDDAHGWRVGEDLTVLAIADGAGSRPGTSTIGAHVAVASVLRRLAAAPETAMPELFAFALQALEDEADALGLRPDRLATTLSVAMLSDTRTMVGQLGDGVAVVETDTGEIRAVALAERFEYANEVVFITTADGLDHVKVFDMAKPVRSMALSTDGLRYKILENLDTGEPFESFFADSWSFARRADAGSPALQRFLESVDDQTGDDKTLVLAVRDFAGPGGMATQLTSRPASTDAEAEERTDAATDQQADARSRAEAEVTP
jgi:hypothetical protein